MAQAERIITAFRELMSRGLPPKSTNPVRGAHAEFVAALAGNAPHPIHSALGPTDLDGRDDHLQKVLAALHVYVAALTADLAQNIPAASVDRLYLDQLFEQFSSDALRVTAVSGMGKLLQHNDLRRALEGRQDPQQVLSWENSYRRAFAKA